LFYICELGKYLKFNYGQALSLDGVLLSECLKNSPIWEYFRLVATKGWVEDFNVSDSDFLVSIIHPTMLDLNLVSNVLLTTDTVNFNSADYSRRSKDFEYACTEPERLQVSFSNQSDEFWLWNINGANGKFYNINNQTFGHNLGFQRFVSLVAMVAVERLKTGKPAYLGVSFSQSLLLSNFSISSYLTILKEDCSCLEGWCHLVYDEDVLPQSLLQVGYSAWYQKGRDKGMLDRWYSGKEKMEYLKKLDVKKGDIVMYYKRPRSSRLNSVKSIKSCHVARVEYITSTDIGLSLFNTTKLYCQAKADFDNQTIAVKKMYCGKLPYTDFNMTKINESLSDLGVEYMMQNELAFIVPLDQCDDSVETLVTNGTIESKVILSQNDFIYYLLKDYGVEFNHERFVDKYFKGTVPFYDFFNSLECTPEQFERFLTERSVKL
jgi:hypothetical protein